jgi:staphylococcal nuclease domain-containing protein 1
MTEQNRATGLFPMLQKADRIEGVVEYVMSGSRMRLFIPKDSLMITFLLSGAFI